MLRKFWKLPWKQKVLIPQILVLLFWYRFRVDHRPFSELSPHIGTLGYETPMERTPQNAWMVHELMEAMLRKFRWKRSCLIRALTAKKLLNRMGERCTLYAGVRKIGDGPMEAHAWLRCGKLIVTGGEIMQSFTVTTMYGDPDQNGLDTI